MRSRLTLPAHLLTLLAGTFLVESASAQIAVANTAQGTFDTSASPNFSISYTVLSASDVLVLGVYADGNGPVTNAQYNGVPATSTITAARTSLLYFLNPTPGAFNLTGTVPSNFNNAYFIWELSNVDKAIPVVSATGTAATVAGDAPTTITTTAPNTFIVDIVGINNIVPVINPDANSILIERAEQNANGATGGGFIAVGDATAAALGIQQLGWNSSNTTNYGEAAFGFAAVPEPGSAAMLLCGIGTLSLVRRRRLHS